ncbi:hypothetical protein BDQ17DRAFT_1174100, partial [Cyathus striatus]
PLVLEDPFYGNEAINRAMSRCIADIFNCPEVIPSSDPQITHQLPVFIAEATQRAGVHVKTAVAAVLLLNRLIIKSPSFRMGGAFIGQGLFLAALMVATKTMYGADFFASRSWHAVGQLLFRPEEIPSYEQVVRKVLDRDVSFNDRELDECKDMLFADY